MNDELILDFLDNEWPNEYIDHERVVVRAIVYDEEENLYFARIERNDIFGKGKFIETSGGGVEENENLESAIKRELKEELGVEVDITCKIGVVRDYYNLIHRHNINNYFLCKVKSFGKNNLTETEMNDFNLSTLKLKPIDAIEEYKKYSNTKLGRLIANRELPILEKAVEILKANKK